jgi:hypothetical protein
MTTKALQGKVSFGFSQEQRRILMYNPAIRPEKLQPAERRADVSEFTSGFVQTIRR